MKNHFILMNPDDKKLLSGMMGDGMYFFMTDQNESNLTNTLLFNDEVYQDILMTESGNIEDQCSIQFRELVKVYITLNL